MLALTYWISYVALSIAIFFVPFLKEIVVPHYTPVVMALHIMSFVVTTQAIFFRKPSKYTSKILQKRTAQ